MRELKIGTSWVRGVVGDALTPELVVNFACAFGAWGDGETIVIGRDPRRSSSMLRSAVLSGLLSSGCEVIDLEQCSTPLVSFAVRELGAAGGLSITGSHNDARWNALKFIGPDGTLLNAVKSEELLDIYHASAFLNVQDCGRQPTGVDDSLIDRYLEHLLSSLDVEPIRQRHFRIAVDFCNGACAAVMSPFLRELGCTLLALNEEPSSRFARRPVPTSANMRDFGQLIQREKVDLGAAINVDGDRVTFLTAAGDLLSEEHTLPLAAFSRLSRRPGTVVTNLSTSRMIDAVASRYDQSVVRTSVGEGHVMDRGLEAGAVLAGEGSGGVGALPTTMTFDAMLTLAMLLETLATNDTSPRELVDQLPRYVMRKGELACSPDQVYRVLETICSGITDGVSNVVDGVRVDWNDAWMHVRASNTEPLLRVIVEAETDERARTIFEEAMTQGREAVGAPPEL